MNLFRTGLVVAAVALSSMACGPRTVDLKLAMEPGDTRRVQTTSESMMTMDSDIGSVVVETKRSAQLLFTVLSTVESGDVTFDVAIEDAELEMSTIMGRHGFCRAVRLWRHVFPWHGSCQR
jgi:hypothetical protein